MMDRAALRQALVELLEENKGEKYADFNENQVLRQELGLDSVDFVQFTMEIQDRFQLHLTIADLEQVVRVGDLLDLLQGRLGPMPSTA
jgi:acyl carrier protein